MGGDWVFSAEFRLGTMKSTHLLCKHLTFLSNLYGGQKKGEEFPLFLGMISRKKMFLKWVRMGFLVLNFYQGP